MSFSSGRLLWFWIQLTEIPDPAGNKAEQHDVAGSPGLASGRIKLPVVSKVHTREKGQCIVRIPLASQVACGKALTAAGGACQNSGLRACGLQSQKL